MERRALTRDDYDKLNTGELMRRYKHLERDTSCQTVEEELGRMFAMQEMASIFVQRGVIY